MCGFLAGAGSQKLDGDGASKINLEELGDLFGSMNAGAASVDQAADVSICHCHISVSVRTLHLCPSLSLFKLCPVILYYDITFNEAPFGFQTSTPGRVTRYI